MDHRFHSHVPHWERAIGAQIQLMRSRLNLTRLVAGRPVTQAQRKSAGQYMDQLRAMARAEEKQANLCSQKHAAADEFSTGLQRRHQESVIQLAELETLRQVRLSIGRLDPDVDEMAEMDAYIENMESGREEVDQLAREANRMKLAEEVWAWRLGRRKTRIEVIKREIETVVKAAGLPVE